MLASFEPLTLLSVSKVELSTLPETLSYIGYPEGGSKIIGAYLIKAAGS